MNTGAQDLCVSYGKSSFFLLNQHLQLESLAGEVDDGWGSRCIRYVFYSNSYLRIDYMNRCSRGNKGLRGRRWCKVFFFFHIMFFVTILMSMDSTPPLNKELMMDGFDV